MGCAEQKGEGSGSGRRISKKPNYLNYHQLLHYSLDQEPSDTYTVYFHIQPMLFVRKLFSNIQIDNFCKLNTSISKLIKIMLNWDFYLSDTAGIVAGSHTPINVSDY